MERENRFTVFKNKDITKYLTDEEQEYLDDLCRKINRLRLFNGKPIIKCMVVESHRPEYEKVWELIETTDKCKNP